ncbi:MAG: ParB/RepB/Spo0J family partition protein [Nanoarchaeota archaeon]
MAYRRIKRKPFKANKLSKWQENYMDFVLDVVGDDLGYIPTKFANSLPTYPADMEEWKINPKGGRYSPRKWKNFINTVKKLGVYSPIIIRKSSGIKTLVDGNHRTKAAFKIGIKKIPAIVENRWGLVYHPRLKPFGIIAKKKRGLLTNLTNYKYANLLKSNLKRIPKIK